VVALVAAGAFAGLLWWGYFDRPAPALEHRGARITDDVLRGRYARDVYTIAHAPLVAGVVLAAAALEEIALHPADPVPTAFRAMMFGGLALTVGGVAGAVWRAFRTVAWERVAGTLVVGAVVLAAPGMAGATLLVVLVALLVVSLVVEHLRREPGHVGRSSTGLPGVDAGTEHA
jgi:low temperature requirement protein LtrA